MTLCVQMLRGINSPLPPISRCSKWRTTHSPPERYSLSLCCDLSLHVQRRKLASLLPQTLLSMCCDLTQARTRTDRQTHARAERQTDARMIRNSSLPVCLRHNEQEGNCKAADTPLRILNERSGEGGREGESGALREGVPNWQPQVPITWTAVGCHCNTSAHQ